MKIINEVRKIDQKVTLYVAFDGKEFVNYYECRNYESLKLEEKVFATVEHNEEAETFAPCDGGEYMESHNYHWFRPRSEDDVDLLCECYGDSAAYPDDIGKWVCVDCNDDGEGWGSTLDYSIKYAKQLIELFGYKVLVVPPKTTFDKQHRKQLNTVGELKNLLENFDDSTPLFCCGATQTYLHVLNGNAGISIDTEPLDEEYDEVAKNE